MPLHKGHIGLIEFAAQQCDELIVSMSYTLLDPIEGEFRFTWIKHVFKDNPKITANIVEDDFDNPSLALNDRTKVWSDFLKSRYPPIDLLFSSEEYGEPLAAHLGAKHIVFDKHRISFPISATQIRNAPFKHWEYIPMAVRPYYVKKICFYGPESTGKSSMTIRMADHYNTTWVPEVAREMIINNDFTIADILQIGYAQYDRIFKNIRTANKLLMCDTDAITTQIYSQHYLKTIPPVLFELEEKVKYERYFLFDVDVPWVDDGLRDLGDQRKLMFAIFQTELEKRSIPYVLVSGSWEQRKKTVTDNLDQLLEE